MVNQFEIHLNKLHSAQQFILDNSKRFNVLKCGRRFGKTELTKELAINPLLDGQRVGYWTPTYKDLHDVWSELKFTLSPIISEKNEQVKQITLITGGVIDMWSLEDPDNGRGRKYHRVIIDEAEKGRNLEKAWKRAIRPTLTDYKGDAWFMSTPKFGLTYFKKLAKMSETEDNWSSFKFTTYDNPFIDPLEIDEARRQLDDLTFQCEYMADDVDIVDKPFAYCYDETKHVGECFYNDNYELLLSFDFNRDPMTCIAVQRYDDTIWIIKEFKLAVSNTYDLCEKIKVFYPNALFIVTGDASGNAGSAMVKDNINHYKIIKSELNLSPGQLRVPTHNPKIAENRVLVNSVLQHKKVQIHPDCVGLRFDLKYAQVDEMGDLIKDRSSESAKCDLLDCFVAGTEITTEFGIKNIEDIKINDKVLTRNGYKLVTDKWNSFQFVYKFTLTDGTELICTKDHRFYNNTFGFIEICRIFNENLSIWKLQSNTTAETTENTLNKNTIIAQSQREFTQGVYIGKCGLMLMDRFRKVITYITKTITHSTTQLKTLNWSSLKNIVVFTQKKGLKTILNSLLSFRKKGLKLLLNGTSQKPVSNGIDKMQRTVISESKHLGNIVVNSVQKNLKKATQLPGSVPIIASQHGEEKTNRILKKQSVKNVAKLLNRQNTNQIDFVPSNVSLHQTHTEVKVKSMQKIGIRRVYDITVKDEHEFYANGILVHNCFRYDLNLHERNFLKFAK